MMSPFWLWEKAVPAAVCDALLAEAKLADTTAGTVFGDTPINKSLRDNDVCTMPPNHWAEGILTNHCRYANGSAGWGFSITSSEPMQVAFYEMGQFYDWHADSHILGGDHTGVRKLSAVLQLSDAGDFEGGGLLIDGHDGSVLKNKGDIVVFPSFLRHKAVEVTKGHRATAVLWMGGPHFV